MKNLSFKNCLVLAAFLASPVGAIASDLPPCPSSGYFHNCFGTYSWYDGDKYVGEWKDDKKNGQGTYTSAGGDKYVGEYQDDMQHGQGIYTYASGSKYIGGYKDGKKNGQGTYISTNGEKYVGEFKDGKLNGYAIQYSADDSILKEGIWKDDKFTGQ